MKPRHLLSTFFILFSFNSFSQKTNIAYAITGQANGNFNWTDIRVIDLSTGKASNPLFESGKTKFVLASFKDGKNVTINADAANSLPTQSMVAAAAYDKKHDKLF